VEEAVATVQTQSILAPLQAFIAEADEVLQEHDRYLQRPVDVPDDFVHSAEIITIVSRLANGEQVFGLFAFKEKSLRPALESVRVVSRSPSGPEDWAHVRDHLRWRQHFQELNRRWHALSFELGAPVAELTFHRVLSQLVALLRAVTYGAPAALRQLEQALPQVAHGTETARSLWSNPSRLISARDSLRSAAAAARLSAAKAEIKRVGGLFNGGGWETRRARAELLGKCRGSRQFRDGAG